MSQTSQTIHHHHHHHRLVEYRRAALDNSGNFDFCCTRKILYDFLLVINCHLSCISHCFWDIACRKPSHSSSSHLSRGPPSNFAVKFTTLKAKTLCYFYVKKHDPAFSRIVIIIEYTRVTADRETDDNIMTSRTLQ